MKITFHISTPAEEERPPQILATAIELPRGCGLDEATAQIEKVTTEMKHIALELFAADTEGREPQLEGIKSK